MDRKSTVSKPATTPVFQVAPPSSVFSQVPPEPLAQQTWSEIAYIQIGDNPGRKEPGTGEVNYANVFQFIHKKGFTGILGMEHGNAYPGKEGELALIDAYRKVDVK